MNGTMNENQLTVAKEYEFDKPLSDNLVSILGNCYRVCYNNYFQTYKYRCV